jgi:hypothetical protein
MEWPLRLGSTCGAVSVAPPYRADAYINALTGSPPATNVAVRVGPGRKISLTTPYGQRLTALEAGRYTVTVNDLSPRDSFHLLGPGTNRSTSVRAVGTRTWTLNLPPGTYRYRSDRPNSKLRGIFVVLATD